MKNYAFFFLFIGILLPWNYVAAQDCDIYKDFSEGTTTRMVHYDKKDKVTGYTITTVTEKKKLSNGVSMLFHQVYDDTEEYKFESDMRIECRGGEVIYSMENFIDPTTLSAYEGMEFEISADDLSIPSNAKPGDELNDGAVSITINTGSPVKVTVTSTISNRKVVSKESVETPAGKFDCLKISYDVLTQIAFVKMRSSTVEFYNEKSGVVKTESFNKKGKLTGYSLLEEIKK